MHTASHMDWDFFYRQGWGGVLPYQGVELHQHRWCREQVVGCRQLFPPGSTWAGQEIKTFRLKDCARESWVIIVYVSFGLTTRSWAAHIRLFRLNTSKIERCAPLPPPITGNYDICARDPNDGIVTLQRKSHLHVCIPRKGIARPQSQFPHSSIYEWAIYIQYSQDRSTYFPAAD
jgi:hypothetical protein